MLPVLTRKPRRTDKEGKLVEFHIQAFTITQRLSTDTDSVRYWRVDAARMQGLEVEVQTLRGNSDDWETILAWNDDLSRWCDSSDGATFSDIDFNMPIGSNSEAGTVGGGREAQAGALESCVAGKPSAGEHVTSAPPDREGQSGADSPRDAAGTAL